MDDEIPPHHVTVDCSTGETTHVLLTPEEIEADRQTGIEHAAVQAQQQKEEDELRAAVAVHPDPIVQALAKRVGLL